MVLGNQGTEKQKEPTEQQIGRTWSKSEVFNRPQLVKSVVVKVEFQTATKLLIQKLYPVFLENYFF